MRGVVAVTRVLLLVLAIAFVANCAEDPTAPERGVSKHPTIAFAAAGDSSGLSITTDKDDYSPGDTVWFAGAGWTPGDSLDVVLTDDPTLDRHEWAVGVGPDGMFRDSTYVVDAGDLDVRFTLTATSRETGRSLTVQFTDATLVNNGVVVTPSIQTITAGSQASYAVSVSFGGNTTPCTPPLSASGLPAGATPTFTSITGHSGDTPKISSLTITTAANIAAGTYPFVVTASHLGTGCNGADRTGSGTLVIQSPVPPPTALGFITAARTAAVGQCTAILTVQSQLTDGTPANVTASTTLTLSSTSSGGSFYTDATCSTSGATTIAAGSNSADFYYKDTDAGTPTITAAATGLTSATQQQTISAGNAQVAVTALPAAGSVFGQSVTFKATVTAVAPAAGTPTGSVTFHDGPACSDAQIGTAKALAAGIATSDASTTLSVGDHTITACYGGGGGFGAQSGQVAYTVSKAATTTAVASSVNPSVFSQTVTFTATVSVTAPGAGTATGSVTLKDGTCAAGVSLGSSTTLNGSAQASFNVATLSAAAHTVTACYQGDDDFEGSSGSVSQTVTRASTTTSLTSSANPSVFSQSVTFSVTVTPDAPAVATPVGSVTLKDGTCAAGTTIGGPSALDGSGTASFSVSGLAVATHPVNACYAGNGNFEPSDDAVSQVVNKAQTTASVSSDANPSVFSQAVTFSVTVSPRSPAVATPAGDVTLFDGTCSAGTTLGGPATLDASGEASFTVSTLGVGSHTVTACYAGNGSFEASDGSVTQTVNKASTATALTSSVNPSVLAQPVTFGVTVSPVSPAVATPQGNVTLKDGTCTAGTLIGGPSALDVSGKTSFSISSLPVGMHTISACYAGNASFEASGNGLNQQVVYNFDGLFAPVDKPNTMNLSKAGQGIPLKWRLTDFNGAPVLNFNPAALGVAVTMLPCSTTASVDQIEEYAGNSGLQNLGDGYYQFNWKTPSSYANSCRAIGLNLGEGTARGPLAFFNFKK